MIGGVPVAATVKVIAVPSQSCWETGWDVIVGGKKIVNVAGLLVAVKHEFVTTTS